MIVNAKKQKIKALQKAVKLYGEYTPRYCVILLINFKEEVLKNASQGESLVVPQIDDIVMEASSDNDDDAV